MTKPICLFAVLLTGCDANKAELAAVQAHLDAELASRMERAQNLNEQRMKVDWLELKLKQAVAGLPQGVEAGEPPAPPAPPVAPPLPLEPAMPGESMFEGSDGKRARARIEETRRRIGELERILFEVEETERKRAQLERRLNQLQTLSR